jgi:KaiC/GvpD/RAD55 family RecA-like ATPase
MYTIIKSVLDRPAEDVQSFLEQILKSEHVLTTEEKEFFELLHATLPSGTTPTEELFLEDSTRLSVQDARAKFAVVTGERNRNRLANTLNAIASEVAEQGLTDAANEKLRRLRGQHRTRQDTLVPYDALPTVREIYEERKNRRAGLYTFVKEIDEAIGGMDPGSLNTIMGWTGHFKSTWALNIAYNNAFKNGLNIAYMSFEMAREELVFNFLSRHSYHLKFDQYSSIPHNDIRRGVLAPDVEEYLLDVIAPDFFAPAALGETKGKIYILDASHFRSRDIDDIQEKMEEMDDRCVRETGAPIDCFVWDHLQMFKFSSSPAFKGMSEYAVMNAYVNQFMNWALDFRGRKTIQLLLAQVNREGWKRAVSKKGDYGVYDLTALAEVNEAERASSRVLSIFTDDRLKASEEAMAQILKSRYGAGLDFPVTVHVQPACAFVGDDDNVGSSLTRPSVSILDLMFAGSPLDPFD